MEMLEKPSSSRTFPDKTPTKRTFGLTEEELESEEPPTKKKADLFSFRIPRKSKDDVEEDDEVSVTWKNGRDTVDGGHE